MWLLLPFKNFDHIFLNCCGEWFKNTSRAWSFFFYFIDFSSKLKWKTSAPILRRLNDNFHCQTSRLKFNELKKAKRHAAFVVFFPWFFQSKKSDHDMSEVKSRIQGFLYNTMPINFINFDRFPSITITRSL